MPRNRGLHDLDFESRNVLYTDTFRDSKFDLVVRFRPRKMPYTAIFEDSKCALHGHISRIWIQRIQKLNLLEFESKCVLHGYISGPDSREKCEFRIREILFAGVRKSAEMCPTRAHFGFKNEAKLHFLNDFAHAQKSIQI